MNIPPKNAPELRRARTILSVRTSQIPEDIKYISSPVEPISITVSPAKK